VIEIPLFKCTNPTCGVVENIKSPPPHVRARIVKLVAPEVLGAAVFTLWLPYEVDRQ